MLFSPKPVTPKWILNFIFVRNKEDFWVSDESLKIFNPVSAILLNLTHHVSFYFQSGKFGKIELPGIEYIKRSKYLRWKELKFLTNMSICRNISVKFIFKTEKNATRRAANRLSLHRYSLFVRCSLSSLNFQRESFSIYFIQGIPQRSAKYSADWKPSTWELCVTTSVQVVCHINRRHAWTFHVKPLRTRRVHVKRYSAKVWNSVDSRVRETTLGGGGGEEG